MAVSDAEFKQALSSWATGVTIVTTRHQGKVYGLTVSSFSTLSIDPQLVLVCIQNSNHLEHMARASQVIGISVLSLGQEDISSHFAISGRDPVDSYDGTVTAITGSPLFEDSITQIDCELRQVIDGGDHAILLAEPVFTHYDGERRPLMYYGRGYRSLLLD
jgi:flavin reductase (DIM6/NTAB) family NADH-FMN oxidoreductase RutF